MDVYEHTHSFDRDGCIVGARFVSYTYLERDYVCAACGGNPIHHITRVLNETYDYAECAQCGARDFISQLTYDRQVMEYGEILRNLPPELRALFPEKKPLDITADEAISQLFDQGETRCR